MRAMAERSLVLRGLGAAVVVALLDQATKWWIVEQVMRPPRVIPVTPFFNLVMGWNPGVSFGMFGSGSPAATWILIGLAAAVVSVLLVWLARAEQWWIATAIGMIVGGALGNVVDRLRFGAVADFLDVHVAGYHWPAFNVADSGITIGAVVLIADSLFAKPEPPS